MSTSLLLIAPLLFIGLLIFIFGFLVGLAIKSYRRYCVRTNQDRGEAAVHGVVPKGAIYPNQLVEFLKNFQGETISASRVEFCVGRLECKRYEVTKMTGLQHRAYLAQKFDRNNGQESRPGILYVISQY
jgi:hypothetical protein